jgi:hypothetical protein
MICTMETKRNITACIVVSLTIGLVAILSHGLYISSSAYRIGQQLESRGHATDISNELPVFFCLYIAIQQVCSAEAVIHTDTLMIKLYLLDSQGA